MLHLKASKHSELADSQESRHRVTKVWEEMELIKHPSGSTNYRAHGYYDDFSGDWYKTPRKCMWSISGKDVGKRV